jgi:hypothetical protein
MENMETENSLASETASGMQYITRAGRLRTGRLVTNQQQILVVTGGTSGANPRTTTTRRTGSTQQPTTQPDESVSAELAQQTTTTGKPRQRIKWDEEMNTFIMRSYYIDTENETNMAMYRQNIYHAFVAQYPNIRVTEQRIADQRRAIIKRKLLSNITIIRIQQEALNLLNDDQNNNEAENTNTTDNTNVARNQSTSEVKQRSDNKEKIIHRQYNQY